MKRLLLKLSLMLAALPIAGQIEAQEYINFDIYGFMTKTDVSYNTPYAQQYVVSKMTYTTDSSSPYYLQKQTAAFNSNVLFDDTWVKVCACYVREDAMYVVRHCETPSFNRISTYDGKGNETLVAEVSTANGYITQAAYVEEDDMVYMVFSTPRSSNASLYKAPGSNPSELTFVAEICSSFMDKPFAFTYCKEKDLFFYVTNSAKLYSLSRTGEKDYYYGIYPKNAYLPSDGSDDSPAQYIDLTSGLVWAPPYNMLIWACPRGASLGSSLTYWYGLELVKNSETSVVHSLINHTDSGLTNNIYNCMTTQGINMSQGLPPAPTYVSVYSVNGKPGYYDISWPAVKNDIDGQPIEGEIYYNVYIGDNQIAKKAQPAKGSSVGVRILLPHEYTEDTFYVGVETVTETGTSNIKVEGPVKSSWDPDDPGSWYNDPGNSVAQVSDSGFRAATSGNTLILTGLDGEIAVIYSIDGKLINTLYQDGSIELASGFYIVKADNKTVKIIIK